MTASPEWDDFARDLRRKLIADWPEAAREDWAERMCIKMYDAEMSEEQAEREAFYEVGEKLGLIL